MSHVPGSQPRPDGRYQERGINTMRSIKRLFLVATTIAALTLALVPAAAASSKTFYLDKTCAEAPAEPLGFICTVMHSSFKWIPPGTDIRYAAIPGLDPVVVQAATIRIKNGSTTGACTWSSAVDAVCIFGRGTGRLNQLHLEVVVTASADQTVWYWNGGYRFGG